MSLLDLHADVTPVIFNFIPKDNHLKLQFVCKWTETPGAFD
jgi:hypothetical protein